MARRSTQFIFMLFLLVMALVPAASRAEPLVTGVAVEVLENGAERVKFLTAQPLEAKKAFALSNPDRVAIDIPAVAVTGIALPENYTGALIKALRFGRFDAETSRIVLDLNGPARVVSSSPGMPLVVEIAPTGELPNAVAASPVAAKGKKTSYVMSPEQKKPLIIIDSGHGGDDPGALGLHGTHEKDVTLNYARALRDALLATGRYRAELTRASDRFIKLGERVEIARKQKADMFISLHADSNPRPEARGLSIYTLSETASDDEAQALADSENKSDIIPGVDLRGADADVASILIDLTQRETMNKSATLADAVVKSLHPRITQLPGTHRYAGFRVLKAPDIPSVLIELGFLSNATDERLLLTSEYRERVIESIVKGVDRYRAAE